ncbi:aspartate/glutamate racemase family protein [Humitalea sp. 24SJ18S-53]|uniref:aspartate/glutamate racemase family protein n=1 Tax=Humitalea sp. 24SJ18S-53 TaxID=3422307 RepID=UPI003D66C858
MDRRILVINPNSDAGCTAGIATAVAPFARPGVVFDTISLPGGPPAIVSWDDWFGVAQPLERLVAGQDADAIIIACVSDPGIDLLRSTTPRPVFGPLRCGVAAAAARADRFGLIAFVDASRARQRRVLQAMGMEARCAGIVPLNLSMASLLDPDAPRIGLRDAARALAGMGAEAIVMGCAGMAAHRAFLEDACGLPVIEPIQAAAAQALAAVVPSQN